MAILSMHWNELRGKPVKVDGQGRQIGIVEDFYYEPATNSINALRVNASLKGHRVLLASAISFLGREGVTIANEYRLIDEANAGPIYQFPLGDSLIGMPVVGEKGQDAGTIRDLLLGISPPIALRISALEMNGGNLERISTSEVASFGETEVTIRG